MYAAGRQGLYPSHPPLSPGVITVFLSVYTFWRGLCLLSHRSSANQIQGWFFSKTSLQSVSLFLFPCSTEVRLVTRQDEGDSDKLVSPLPSHLEDRGKPILSQTQLGSPTTLLLLHFCDPCFLMLPQYSLPFFSPSLPFLLTWSMQGKNCMGCS